MSRSLKARTAVESRYCVLESTTTLVERVGSRVIDASQTPCMIKPILPKISTNYTTLDGGSLGSWVEEDRGEMRELMVIAKFSRDSIDMSNAHCGDCLAGAIESIHHTCV